MVPSLVHSNGESSMVWDGLMKSQLTPGLQNKFHDGWLYTSMLPCVNVSTQTDSPKFQMYCGILLLLQLLYSEGLLQ